VDELRVQEQINSTEFPFGMLANRRRADKLLWHGF